MALTTVTAGAGLASAAQSADVESSHNMTMKMEIGQIKPANEATEKLLGADCRSVDAASLERRENVATVASLTDLLHESTGHTVASFDRDNTCLNRIG